MVTAQTLKCKGSWYWWCPNDELTTMVAMSSTGAAWGNLIGMGGVGLILKRVGWEGVHYLSGLFMLIAAISWILLATNRPETRFYFF